MLHTPLYLILYNISHYFSLKLLILCDTFYSKNTLFCIYYYIFIITIYFILEFKFKVSCECLKKRALHNKEMFLYLTAMVTALVNDKL